MKMDQWELKKACLECNWEEFLKQVQKPTQINDDIVQVCIFWGRLKYLEKIVSSGKATIIPEHIECAFKRNHWHILLWFIKNCNFHSTIFAKAIEYYKGERIKSIYPNKEFQNIKDYQKYRKKLLTELEENRPHIANVIQVAASYLKNIDDDVFDNLCNTNDIKLLETVLQYDIEFRPKLQYSWPVNDFLYNNRQFCTQILKEIDLDDLKKIAYQSRFLQCPIEKYLDYWDGSRFEFLKWRISRHALALASVFPPYVIEHIISFCIDPEYRDFIVFHHRIEIITNIVNILKKRNI